MITRQIIALGGGGFSMEPDNLALERYLLRQIQKPIPNVCFLATASGDSEGYILRFYEAFVKLECKPSHLSLFRPPKTDLEDYLLEKDIIYVGGGNTINMLTLWREWDVDRILKKAYKKGIVLAGISAGANCWFEQCITDSVPGDLQVLSCLGYLSGSFCPHYDGEPERRPAFHRFLENNRIKPGFAADDGAAMHYINEQPFAMISSRPIAKVYKLSKQKRNIIEEPLDTKYLNE